MKNVTEWNSEMKEHFDAWFNEIIIINYLSREKN